MDTAGSDGATLELTRFGLWLCAAWLVLAAVAVLGSYLPGAAGRGAALLVGRVVPTALHRAIGAAIGASVLLAPVTAGAVTAPGAAAVVHAPQAWPWPTSAPTTAPARADVPSSPAPAPAVPWPRTSSLDPHSGDILVRPGDCLWAIAAHRLGTGASAPRIAAYSRRWYHANAAVIGTDADLIHPGQHLHEPTEKGH